MSKRLRKPGSKLVCSTPLNEALIYRHLQSGSGAMRLPPPKWYIQLDVFEREELGKYMIRVCGLSHKQREEAWKQIERKFSGDKGLALNVYAYFMLLRKCKPFFEEFGAAFQSAENRPLARDSGSSSLQWANKSHKNIARFIGDFTFGFCHYLVMENCEGGDLHSYVLKQKGLKDQRECASIFSQLLSSVAFLHSRGVCHLDLSLENLVLARDNPPQIKLIDFEHARFLSQGPFKGFHGKMQYQAPEAWKGQPYTGIEADVYGMGIVLALMSLGFPPFPDSNSPRYWAIVNRPNGFRKILQNYNLSSLADSLQNTGLLDLITRMIAPATRRASIPEIINHPWFKAFAPPDVKTEVAETLDCEVRLRTGTALGKDEKVVRSRTSSQPNIPHWTEGGFLSVRPPNWTSRITKNQLSVCYQKMRTEWRRAQMSSLCAWLQHRFGISEDEATEFLWFLYLKNTMYGQEYPYEGDCRVSKTKSRKRPLRDNNAVQQARAQRKRQDNEAMRLLQEAQALIFQSSGGGGRMAV
eukprot:CAMPEP_0167773360 /NCGR_PEP_ID=MMETSP0111_2-20121227/1375_1 /TAXON_ID=91324 /ORGANISM="Lotharella globosa, Strain CCCM811" /LENGTH=525 /DNA_ID=CAMNT_0007662985 /DNA_START=328 /DNA_END=1905 /DNA_ORIENTATION=-